MVLTRSEQPNAWLRNPLFRAWLVSLIIHALLYGAWELNRRTHFMEKIPLVRLITLVQELLTPLPPLAAAQPPPQLEVPLYFVEVDVSKAVDEAPKDTTFYSSVSTEAANPKPADTPLPQIEGKERPTPKVVENSASKAKPLQPSPPPPEEQPREQEQRAKPKQSETPGDLALAKPQEKPKPEKHDNPQSEEPGKSEETTQRRPRPKTLAEAKAGLPGEKSKNEGGVQKVDITSSLAAKGTLLGDYDAQLIDAVRQKWHAILERATATQPGKVVMEFRLHYDGRVSDLKVVDTSVGDLQSLYCEMAIREPSPYRKWPMELRREIKGDTREVRFTFYYE